MAIDSMLMRLVGGNVANPQLGNEPLSAHSIMAAFQMWGNGEITKVVIVDAYDLTHANDDGDLDLLKQWFSSARSAGLEEKFAAVMEGRLLLARDKKVVGGGIEMDGKFGYAVKSTFVGGADGVHSLSDTGAMAERFTTWAA